ncbi:MAG: hypothetical protein QME64_08080 [bacterium]|nr:hypothetical protein [bacterium]
MNNNDKIPNKINLPIEPNQQETNAIRDLVVITFISSLTKF